MIFCSYRSVHSITNALFKANLLKHPSAALFSPQCQVKWFSTKGSSTNLSDSSLVPLQLHELFFSRAESHRQSGESSNEQKASMKRIDDIKRFISKSFLFTFPFSNALFLMALLFDERGFWSSQQFFCAVVCFSQSHSFILWCRRSDSPPLYISWAIRRWAHRRAYKAPFDSFVRTTILSFTPSRGSKIEFINSTP